MLRPNRLLVVLTMLIALPGVVCAQDRNVEFNVAESFPGLAGKLRVSSKVYIKLNYRSDRPVGFHVDAYAAGRKFPATTNIVPSYPAGEGEALVWFSYEKPTTIDEIRISAVDQRWRPLSSISVPVKLEWTGAVASSQGPLPEWAGRLSREQQERASRAARERQAKDVSGGMLVVGVGGLAILGYFVLQPMMISTLTARWRIAAFVPLVAMVPLFAYTAYAFAHDSNLWPLGLIFFTPFATLYLLALGGMHWLVTRRTNP